MKTEQKISKDRYLLICENVISLLSVSLMFSIIAIAYLLKVSDWVRDIVIIVAILAIMPGILFSLRLEQIAGYYECAKCHNRYVPTFKSVLLASHIGSTRHLKCPFCQEKSWNRKVLDEE